MARTGTLVALAAAAAAIALTVSLGNWQLRRADEKLALQAAWDRAEQAAPVAVAGGDFAAVAGRLPLRVRLRGRFVHGAEVWLENRQMDGQAGLMLVAPLRLADGAVVLVNRGFARRDPRDRARLPEVVRPEGEVEVEGLAVPHAARVLQLGENAPARRRRRQAPRLCAAVVRAGGADRRPDRVLWPARAAAPNLRETLR
ncbi:MAG: SURF1 family protein [Burkholderiaceae bacterium]|nr:SURF1 family protein [Burkholderiaceae bacterium]